METIKTAVVVVLLIAVLYGVYVVLTKPELAPPPQIADWQQNTDAPPQIEVGGLNGVPGLQPVPLDQQPAPPTTLPAPPTAPQALLTGITPPPGSSNQPPPANESLPQPPPTPLVEAAPVAQASSSASMPAHSSSVGDAELQRAPAPQVSIYGQAADTAAPAADALAKSDTASPRSAAGGSIYGVTPEAGASTAPASDTPEPQTMRAFDSAWSSAIAQLERQQWSEALLTLSLFYNEPELSSEERQRLVDLLDPLAGKVIYSTEHTLEAPYEVRAGETLDDVAQIFQVPVTLLQNVNGLTSAGPLPPGAVLKVVRGPFRGEVDLKRGELAVFVGRYYAGRFPVNVGHEPTPAPAECAVIDKQPGRDYTLPDGTRIPARAADNPYGGCWLDLGNNVAIHGSPETIPAHGGLGCVSLSTADAADVFSILSVGSKVLIR